MRPNTVRRSRRQQVARELSRIIAIGAIAAAFSFLIAAAALDTFVRG